MPIMKLTQITNPILESSLTDPSGGSSLGLLIARLYRISVVVGGISLLLFMAWGGINWITAGGDQQKAEQARSRITNAVIGMAVLVGVLAVAELLSEGLFGFDILSPNFQF